MEKKLPSLKASLIILMFMVVGMSTGVFILKIPIHITLLLVTAFSVLVLMLEGTNWDKIMWSIEEAGKLALPPLLILYIIGALIGTWIASGTVPLIVYWGLKIINPSMFLVTTTIISSVVSIATGSSWSTAGTVGVALMGVGTGLGVNPAMTAGAIISGAYLGDKMSPLSDTTNLAPAVAEGDLFDHIRSMLYTTVPGFVITLIVFFVLGMNYGGEINNTTIDNFTVTIGQNFNLNILTLIPPAIILVCAIKKIPSLITLIIATLAAAVLGIFLQGETITSMASIMNGGYVSNTGLAEIDSLLSRGGFQSMNWTASLAMLGITLGSILEKNGVLEVLLGQVIKLIASTGGLVAATVLSTIGLNMITASQYTSIVISGRMFVSEYKRRDMLPQTLSRTLEDSGTITSPLVPWNTCAVFMAGTLGVSTVQYAPFAILCWVVPIISIVFGFMNKFQWKTGEIESKKVYEKVAGF